MQATDTAMRTLTVAISDSDYTRFGLRNDQLNFADLMNLVSKELTRRNLAKSVELAEQYGLSQLTMDDITAEVNAVRQDAKGHHCYERDRFGSDPEKLSVPNC